jgi:hypothetical protein
MRTGDWMQTFTGRQFWPLDPRAEDIFIEDIAHALSMQCRYAGHCLRFYSVAEHCVLLARHLRDLRAAPDIVRWALMHDASEAYLVDVPRPVKPHLAGYRDAEAKVMAAVAARFGLPAEIPQKVHDYDSAIIADERVNLSRSIVEWHNPPIPLRIRLENWPPELASVQFMAEFRSLFPEWRP